MERPEWVKLLIAIPVVLVLALVAYYFVANRPSAPSKPALLPNPTATADPQFASDSFTLDVTGDSGTTFTGSCLVSTATGNSKSQDAAGQVPASFRFTGNEVTCVLQKKDASNSLVVAKLSRGGLPVLDARTSQAYGVISVGGR